MSPKKLTMAGVTSGVVSLAGLPVMLFVRPEWGLWAWWPAFGLGLAMLLFVGAFAYGAYLTAQKRANMVDMLNDCYSGVKANDEA